MRRRTQPLLQSLHRDGEARLADGLYQVVERFGFECANRELIEGGKKYHLGHSLYSSTADHFKAVYTRHLNVEEDHVGRGNVQSCEHLRSVATFSGDGKLRKRRQQLSHTPARGRFVIGDQGCPLSLLHDSTPGPFRDMALSASRLYHLPRAWLSRARRARRTGRAVAPACSRCRGPEV